MAAKTKKVSGLDAGTQTKPATGAKAQVPTGVSAEQRAGMIAAAAYFRAEGRGFAPGGQIDDWLAAEREIDERLGGDPDGEGLLERLRRERDELRVRVHLAKLDLRHEWDELERKWELVRVKSGGAMREARGTGKEVGAAAGALLAEIRDGYRRIRAALQS